MKVKQEVLDLLLTTLATTLSSILIKLTKKKYGIKHDSNVVKPNEP